jgi:diadenosine tetraphosphate (Ap4A) HIT family hydrolase
MVGDPCPFCNPQDDEIVAKNHLCYAIRDGFPASPGHLLVIPYRHTLDFFSMTDEEKQALVLLIGECRDVIAREFHPDGYNIGFNVGEAAGQTVMHCHCHVIPRYAGDVPNPRGGVRRVVLSRRGC